MESLQNEVEKANEEITLQKHKYKQLQLSTNSGASPETSIGLKKVKLISNHKKDFLITGFSLQQKID